MIKSKKLIILHLTGGLGNQLFQLAFAISTSEKLKSKVLIEWSLGNPRLNEREIPEILSYDLPDFVKMEIKKHPRLLAIKATGIRLRNGVAPKKWETNPIIKFAITVTSQIVLSIYFKRILRINTGKGIGFCEMEIKSNLDNFLIGYFQSYMYVIKPEVLLIFQNFQLTDGSEYLEKMKSLAMVENPLIVHVRLGDYKNEKEFGVLPISYYEKAIDFQWSTGLYKKIWVFSDEIELCKEFIPSRYHSFVSWIVNEGESSAEILEVMKAGMGYIIGNSTFSWWAAFLSKNKQAIVCAPSRWFLNLEAPKLFIPANWHTIEIEQ